MAVARGKKREGLNRAAENQGDGGKLADTEELGALPELMRRAVAMGLAGFFTTEGAVRKALGDTVPKDWTDFLVETSERTRSEFLERLSHEIGRVLENVDLAQVAAKLLEGRTLEVKAEFRLADGEPASTTAIRFKKADEEGDE